MYDGAAEIISLEPHEKRLPLRGRLAVGTTSQVALKGNRIAFSQFRVVDHPDSTRPWPVRRALLLMAPRRRAMSGGADGGRLIFLLCLVSLFFLGILLFQSLIGLSPHFFEIIGFSIARFPS